jgi:hypothetical protein
MAGILKVDYLGLFGVRDLEFAKILGPYVGRVTGMTMVPFNKMK